MEDSAIPVNLVYNIDLKIIVLEYRRSKFNSRVKNEEGRCPYLPNQSLRHLAISYKTLRIKGTISKVICEDNENILRDVMARALIHCFLEQLRIAVFEMSYTRSGQDNHSMRKGISVLLDGLHCNLLPLS